MVWYNDIRRVEDRALQRCNPSAARSLKSEGSGWEPATPSLPILAPKRKTFAAGCGDFLSRRLA
jgi:hypothetical protein